MGLTLAREKGEMSKVNVTPQKLEEFRPKSFKQYYDPDAVKDKFWDANSSDEEKT